VFAKLTKEKNIMAARSKKTIVIESTDVTVSDIIETPEVVAGPVVEPEALNAFIAAKSSAKARLSKRGRTAYDWASFTADLPVSSADAPIPTFFKEGVTATTANQLCSKIRKDVRSQGFKVELVTTEPIDGRVNILGIRTA
jgi:hypothetical protein